MVLHSSSKCVFLFRVLSNAQLERAGNISYSCYVSDSREGFQGIVASANP